MSGRIHHEARAGAMHDYCLARWIATEQPDKQRLWLARAIAARLAGDASEGQVAAVERIASAVATSPLGVPFLKRLSA